MKAKLSAFLLMSVLFNGFNPSLIAQPAPTPAADRIASLQQKKELSLNSPFKTVFRSIGPHVMSGRVADMDINPGDPTEFYVAYATGGLWHTTNNGQSFKPIFDSALVIGLGDVTVHWPSRTIWLGTGEANSSRSTYSGLGVYKSDNNGKTWQWLGLPESHHIGKILVHPSNPAIAWVAVTGHLYSANKERGVYKTMDGGNNWVHQLYVNENTGAIGMDLNPQNPDELYACMWNRSRTAWNMEEAGKHSGIYKSTNGGKNWRKLNTGSNGFPANEKVGRIGIAVSPTKPKTIYALLDNQSIIPDTAQKKTDSAIYTTDELKNLDKNAFARLDNQKLDTILTRKKLSDRYSAISLKEKVATGKLSPTALYEFLYDANEALLSSPVIGAELYRSDDSGETWYKTHQKKLDIYNTYGYYFGKLTVSPTNAEKVLVLGIRALLSLDGGATFTAIDKRNTHADHHFVWLNPKRDNHIIIGNDGGVNISYDDGQNWFKANSTPVGQFYAVAVDQAKPYKVYGGLQDNGIWYGHTIRQSVSEANYDSLQYKRVIGGDGMMVQVDNRDNKTIYAGTQFGYYFRTHLDSSSRKSFKPANELGESHFRYNWLTPILLSRHNQDILYMGSHRLHRSLKGSVDMQAISGDLTNGSKSGDVPFGTITCLSESPFRFGMLLAGTDDGNIQLSSDGGYSWKKISANLKTQGLWVSRVVASRHAAGRIYVTLNGYRNDHFKPYVYLSNDYGASWQPIHSNLPFEPVNVILEDPKVANLLYLGTDGGLYVSKNQGQDWFPWNTGMPFSIPVHDLAIQERENELVVATHGRSLYVADLQKIQKGPDEIEDFKMVISEEED